jgi:hypothetical protein
MTAPSDVRAGAGRCWRCAHPVASDDRYCRRCGEGQDAFLAWYYHPLWIIVLGLTVLGPFVLPLVWRTPRLSRAAKWVLGGTLVMLSAWVLWRLAVTIVAVTDVLDTM